MQSINKNEHKIECKILCINLGPLYVLLIQKDDLPFRLRDRALLYRYYCAFSFKLHHALYTLLCEQGFYEENQSEAKVCKLLQNTDT